LKFFFLIFWILKLNFFKKNIIIFIKKHFKNQSDIYYHSHAQLPQLGGGEKERDMNMKIVLKVEWVKHEV